MPTFSTPGGVSVTVNLPIGDLLLVASDRTDTVVQPHAGEDDSAGLRVSYADGRLVVDGPQPRNGFASWLGFGESITARIDLPEGSCVRGVALEGGFRSMGRLGECTFRTDYGEIVLDETGPLTVTTDSGDIAVRHVVGDAEVTSDSGVIQIKKIHGSATVTNEYGETEIGEITGVLHVHGRDSDILVGRTHGDIEAYSESGDIRISEAARGTVNTMSDSGSIEISVPQDAAVAVDLESPNGRVRNLLDRSETAGQPDRSITVRARSHHGDITITPFRPRPGT
ncbi:DUF4097 family beta strand repeat protein [Streptomyces sp. ISL-22]|uniref:DUF4097 family beta strand repeat-containing protein n=1 Tax=unclassified Streptomyces TaxID=2593676 RepID=UPI001BEB0A98|nr:MULTISPECIES: DUF4097 family beta strand repeat-containing protein [unclassified Streptomyces]MBT2418904.1 DUF4097 family beta strand repeat protein [Streptomyces sp. ISL-24]MBT2435663.1 DUF4097 family beta strand repeat protein [Streptomyces sp. ISL-22]